MGHKMICDNFLAVFASLAFCIALQIFLSLGILLDIVMIMVNNRFNINFFLFPFNDKSLHINKPPILSLIFDEISHKFTEIYLQIPAHKIDNILHVLQCLVSELCVNTFCCFESMGNFCVYDQLVYLWHFGFRCVLISWVYYIGLAIAVCPPACSNNWRPYTIRFNKLLKDTNFATMTQNPWNNIFKLWCSYCFDLVARWSSIPVWWLIYIYWLLFFEQQLVTCQELPLLASMLFGNTGYYRLLWLLPWNWCTARWRDCPHHWRLLYLEYLGQVCCFYGIYRRVLMLEVCRSRGRVWEYQLCTCTCEAELLTIYLEWIRRIKIRYFIQQSQMFLLNFLLIFIILLNYQELTDSMLLK